MTVFDFIKENDLRVGDRVTDGKDGYWTVRNDPGSGLFLRGDPQSTTINSVLVHYVSIPGLKRVGSWWIYFLEGDPVPKMSDRRFATQEDLQNHVHANITYAQPFHRE